MKPVSLKQNTKAALKLSAPYRRTASFQVNITKPNAHGPYGRTVKATVERWTSATPGTVEVFAINDIDGVREINEQEYIRRVLFSLRVPRLTCSVPDCDEIATTKRSISINNAPKRALPVCFMHADAADEDQPISTVSTSQPVGKSAAQSTK